jgi:ACS family glucarate transporter-like MFS transporter
MAYRHRTLGFLFFLSVITYLDRVCISVAGPRMQAELHLGPENWGPVIGAFAIGYALFEVPGGMMADRWGARVALTRIVLLWSVFTALTGTVTSFALLLLVRFLFGAGEAGAFPGATSAISRWFPAQERSRSQGVVWMASRLGGMVAPFMVVPIQKIWGWRASFFVFGGVGLIWAVLWFLWYRDRPADKKGVSAEELRLIESGGGTGGRAHRPVAWRKVMKQANFWRLLATYHTYSWGAFFYVSWLHTYLQKGRGFTENEMALWSALPFLFGAIGNLSGGILSDVLVRRRGLRFGRRAVGSTGLALGAAFLLAAALVPDRRAAALCLCFGFLAMDSFLPVAWAMSADLGGRSAGTIAGAMNMAGQLGSFISSVAFGYLVKLSGGNYDRAMLPLAVMTGVAAVLSVGIDPTRPFAGIEADDPATLTPADAARDV